MNETGTKLQSSKIGYYHYNMFHSAYGAPQFLCVFKLEYFWLFIEIFFMLIALTIEPLPTFNKAVDDLTSDPRAAYTFYWFPTYFYIFMSIFALSDYMDQCKRYAAEIFGIISLVWHIIYFIVFWAAPSKRLPSDISGMSVSAGWYWTELFINLILIITQFSGTIGTNGYLPYKDDKMRKVKEDIKRHLNTQSTDPDEVIRSNIYQNILTQAHEAPAPHEPQEAEPNNDEQQGFNNQE